MNRKGEENSHDELYHNQIQILLLNVFPLQKLLRKHAYLFSPSYMKLFQAITAHIIFFILELL